MKTKEEIIFDTVNKHSQTDASFYKYESIDKFREELEEDSDLKLFLEMMDEYANQDKWISIKYRLPEKAKPILLYNSNWIGVGYYKLNFEMDIEGEPDWSDETTEYISGVTHWQPLPQPPKND